jgi:Ca2+-binding RTX toxin-like protein
MAIWYGTNQDEFKDFTEYGLSDDIAEGRGGKDQIFGYGGDDRLWGGDGDDSLHGEYGDDDLYGDDDSDTLYGEDNEDDLYGGRGTDFLLGGPGRDRLYGGPDKDHLTGGPEADSFIFHKDDTGSLTDDADDIIHDFTEEDRIWLKGTYEFSNNTDPEPGEYAIWFSHRGQGWYVTYRPLGADGLERYDILVKGADPHDNVLFF